MRKKTLFNFILPTLLVLFLAGCSNAAEVKNDSPEEIVIGAIYPLTGNSATVGNRNKEALQLAEDLINKKYDLDLPFADTEGIPNFDGAKIRVVLADSQGKPEVAASEAQRLISREKASILIGAYASSNAATIAQVAERNEVPFLVADSNSPSLTEQGYKWLFRTVPSENNHITDVFTLLGEMKKQGKNITNIAIMNENSLWGSDIAKEQLEQAEEKGYNIVSHVEYPSNTTDLNSEVQKIKAAKPDVLLISSYTSDAILFMKTAKELKFQPQAIIASGAGFLDNAFKENMGSQATDIISRELWSIDLAVDKPVYQDLNEEYKKRSGGTDLTGDQVKVIQGLLVAADVLDRSKSLESADLQEAFVATDIASEDLVLPWDGVKFAPDTHQNEKANGILVQYRNDTYSTVFPFELKNVDINWPFSSWDQKN
ncbi:ABC transporter substrate-binding protein [Peribacillus loiseleuriae]|uniref:Leucine-binding protein domain-containing protein n=1 Tax=Peribacillus loiseleuriae TaxID=1679170 RepID=A0A0K9GSR4_9BACI|nr:ABC transporter substrate-binding protein [Peribacillus loiseleuriae]KMY49729.1 hypothetical protein AC625_09420 [Peribacillus loiseleuriae]